MTSYQPLLDNNVITGIAYNNQPGLVQGFTGSRIFVGTTVNLTPSDPVTNPGGLGQLIVYDIAYLTPPGVVASTTTVSIFGASSSPVIRSRTIAPYDLTSVGSSAGQIVMERWVSVIPSGQISTGVFNVVFFQNSYFPPFVNYIITPWMNIPSLCTFNTTASLLGPPYGVWDFSGTAGPKDLGGTGWNNDGGNNGPNNPFVNYQVWNPPGVIHTAVATVGPGSSGPVQGGYELGQVSYSDLNYTLTLENSYIYYPIGFNSNQTLTWNNALQGWAASIDAITGVNIPFSTSISNFQHVYGMAIAG
jgi:hypothetical protein